MLPVQRERLFIAAPRFAVAQLQFRRRFKRFGNVGQCHAILRSFRPGQTRLDFTHIQRQRTGKHRLITGITPQALNLRIGFHQFDLLVAAATEFHVTQGDVIHREESAGGTEFRRHIGNGGAVGQR